MRVAASTVVLCAALGAQIALAAKLYDVRPRLDILPPAPTDTELGLSAFGDRQFLYRQLVMSLQNFGDTGGRVTPLKNYDMPRVIEWLEALDKLDLRAQHHLVLAARYFGLTQDKPQTVLLIKYLQAHVAKDPAHSLQWLTDAIYLATALKDETILLNLADQLATYDFPAMTVVAYQLPAILHEQAGHPEQALAYMERALRLTEKKASERDRAFMLDFIARLRGRAKVE